MFKNIFGRYFTNIVCGEMIINFQIKKKKEMFYRSI